MKKLLLILLLITGFVRGQIVPTIEKKTNSQLDPNLKQMTFVQNVEGKTKSEIFTSLSRWIALNYKSSINVVQLSDSEGGVIIVKGINYIVTSNLGKIMSPNNMYVTKSIKTAINHTLDLAVKEGKYRVSYKFFREGGVEVNMFNLNEELRLTLENSFNDIPLTSKKKKIKMGKALVEIHKQTLSELDYFMSNTNKSIFEHITKNDISSDW